MFALLLTIALSLEGNLYAGGSFIITGTSYLAECLNPTGVSPTWSGIGSGVNANIYSLNYHQGTLYAGGDFSTAGGNPAVCIARCGDPATSPAWSALGSGADNGVRAIVFDKSGNLGLRLAAVYATVVGSGGTIAAESAPGTGTTIRLTLPLAADAGEMPAR